MSLKLLKFLSCLLIILFSATTLANVMTKEELTKIYPSPYIIGEKDTTMPIWPIFKQNATENRLIGYAFESIDLAPIPGFAGVPINLLILLDPKGSFLDVKVLSQHEPEFQAGGLGESQLVTFVSQYKGLSLKQSVKILNGFNGQKNVSPEAVQLDGITRATATLSIMNQTILSSALMVARKKLGFAEGRDPSLIARVKLNMFENHSIKDLINNDLIQHVALSNADIEKKFSGGNGSGLDAEATAHPQEPFIDLYMAYVSVPTIGRNLLSDASWQRLQDRLDPGDQAILILSKGRYSLLGDDFVRGSTPERILLKQDQLPIEMRDLNLDLELKDNHGLETESITVFKVNSQAGLDASKPLTFVLPVTRNKGIIYPEKIVQDFDFKFTLPSRFYTVPESSDKSWRGIWRDKSGEIAILIIALAILSIALVYQKKWAAYQRRFILFKNVYLLFTLFFIGWYAQGQLSIVNLTGAVQTLIAGRSLGYFLYDPVTLILLIFVLISLAWWGRGTFCGWLCPFGALQEFTAKVGQQLKLPQIKLKPETDRRLKWIKYPVLVAILISAIFSSHITDLVVEVEPFKTAITLNFMRSWPFVVYALGLLIANLFIYKFFCRFLCPFGAALAVLGRFRILNWIPRRKECGKPCQICLHPCDYHAITPKGDIQYDECFQCLECVNIYGSDEKCAPLMLEKKRSKIIKINEV